MKKHFFIVLSACCIAALLLAGCSSTPAESFLADAEPADTSIVTEVLPRTVGSAGICKDLAVSGTEKLPGQIAEYIDPFPSDDSGLLYEVDDDLKAQMADNLAEYLDCLFQAETSGTERGLGAYPIVPNEEGTYKAQYEDENLTAVSWAAKIRIFTEAYNIAADMGSGDLLENQLAAAAVKYLDLSAPLVLDETEYTPEGDISQQVYRIVNEEESLEKRMYNHAFQYIMVSRAAGSDSVTLEIERKTVENAPFKKSVPYSTALQYIREKYPDAGPGDIQAEASYNGRVESGRYVPCYKFVIAQGASPESPAQEIKYISMQE